VLDLIHVMKSGGKKIALRSGLLKVTPQGCCSEVTLFFIFKKRNAKLPMARKKKTETGLLSRQEINGRKRALHAKKMSTSGGGRRAIAGVFILALSALSLLSVATFHVKDRVGPGFRNAVGPVGHAIGELLRGTFGVCAYIVPLLGMYWAFAVLTFSREKRRWPQLLALTLSLVSGTVLAQLLFKEDASWAHAPGGMVGRELARVLTALFSTVGTVVLVGAIAAVAGIVGTEFRFLKLCAWAWAQCVATASWTGQWLESFVKTQQQRLKAHFQARKLAAEKAKEEEAQFLKDLEAEEAELNEWEEMVAEAEAAAEMQDKARATTEAERAAQLVEKEKQKLERERVLLEREAAKLAKEAMKSVRAQEQEKRQGSVAAVVPAVMASTPPVAADSEDEVMGFGAEPKWALGLKSLGSSAPAGATAMTAAAFNAAAKRVPTIVESPRANSVPPAPNRQPELVQSVPPVAVRAESMPQVPNGASALARTPLIVEPKAPPAPTKKKEAFEFVDGRTSFNVPPIDVLEMQKREENVLDKDAFLSTAQKLTEKLGDFDIAGEVVEIRPGPVVTMYEFRPAPGVKVSKIAALSDDLAMAMEALRVRIVAPIPGKNVVGVEVPNKKRETVFLKEIAEQDAFQKSVSRLTMCIGKDIEGMPYVFDLAKAPHLLIAGTTGSGKSVAVNAMIMSILLKSTPEEVRFIMVDPKMLELSVYEGIPHLLLPVVTDPRKAAVALQWAVDEMTRRYRLLADAGVRNIAGYNQMVEGELEKRKASQATVEAKAKRIDVSSLKSAAQPVSDNSTLMATVPPSPAQTDASGKKKRKLLIVDVSDSTASHTSEAEAGEAALPTSNDVAVGVAAPKEDVEDPREVAFSANEEVAWVEEPPSRAEELSASEVQALAEAAEAKDTAIPEPEKLTKLPYLVVIIDELADLMMVASKEVETSIARLAQMARAAGIHLMVATQRPSTDVVTGIIKANFPTRVSFMLRSKPDSMTILGTVGAEALLGMGDMLIMPPTSAHLQRVHGCYVSENEIRKVVDHLKAQGKPVYDESILKPRDEGTEGGGEEEDLSDELYDQALALVSEMKQVSISMLQRKMRIGYNRSARMIERMERDGVVGAADGAKPREVLIRAVGEMPGAGAM
jgi:DNA segregation ATPase FtsK/SpoIIIE, S-DNA-T family